MLRLESFPGTDPRLHEAIRIRQDVFVDEQHVPLEQELDGKDETAWHLLAYWEGVPVGTTRILLGPVAKVGRVAVLKAFRGYQIGRQLMEEAEKLAHRHGAMDVMLDAQVSVIPFYEKLGYLGEGDEFWDAGIPHRRMRRSLP